MAATIPIPYTAKKEPTIEFVEHDGLKFKTVFWKHTGDYKGRILYVHGFSEDSHIYVEFFDRLSDLGYDIFFFDQRGAGQTSPDTPGVSNEKYTFEDLDFMVNYNVQKAPNEKLILMGHSMGGGIILNYAIRGKYREHFRTVIAVSPEILLHPATYPNILLRAFARFAYKFLPTVTIDAGLKYEYVTSNKKWIDYIKKHNKKFWMSAPLFLDMLDRGKALLDPEYAAKFDKNIALLLFHSKDDHINWYNGSEKFFSLLSDDITKEFVSFEKAQHSLCIETEEYLEPLLKKIVDFTS